MYRATRAGILAALLIAAHTISGSIAFAQGADAGVDSSSEEGETEGEPSSSGEEGEPEDDVDAEFGEEPPGQKTVPAPKDQEGVGARIPQATLQTEDSPLEPGADRNTGVEGRVVSRKPKKVLPDAPVIAKGSDGKVRNTLTNARGRYKLYLPPGKYTLVSLYDLYNGAQWDDITVSRGKFRKVNFILDPVTDDQVGVDEVEIGYLADTSSEAAQLNIRKEAVTVQDAISAEEISRSGDSSAKGAVKRVVGVTVDEFDRLVIRGLGGRYSRALMNGVSLPGVEPDRPGVPLGIFPTDVLSSVSIIKTGRADLPADFAGGLAILETKLFPEKFTLEIGGSVGFNTNTTFQDRPTSDTPRSDWFTRNSSRRDLPPEIANGGRLTDSQFDRARTFDGAWNVFNKKSAPNFGFDLTIGDQFRFGKDGKNRGGYMVNAKYATEHRFEDGVQKIGGVVEDGQGGIDATIGNLRKGLFISEVSAFGTGSLELDRRHTLSLVSLYSRVFNDKTEVLQGFDREIGNEGERTRFTAITRQIFFNQLRGDHQDLTKRGLRLSWSGFFALASLYQPNERSYQYIVDDNDLFRWRPVATLVNYDLTQRDFGATAKFRVPLWQQAYGTFGGRVRFVSRDFAARRFSWLQGAEANNNQLAGEPDDILGPEGIGTVSQVRETTGGPGPDGYEGTQQLFAGFAQLESPLGTDRLKLLAGVRVEAFLQEVIGFDPIDPSNREDPIEKNNVDPLPSLTLSWEPKDDMFFRVGYSMTVARPVFREISEFRFIDTTRQRVISGNPDLVRSRIQNVDLRWEKYFGNANLVAASAFYKQFKDPIELVSNAANDATYQNVDLARVGGLEVEARLQLGGHFSTAGNATVAFSRVRLTEEQAIVQESSRPLAFQSPFVINLSLTYDNPDAGFNATLAYNVFGRRLVEVAIVQGAGFLPPNVEELPFHSLNLNVGYSPIDQLTLKLQAKNLAFQPRRFEQGNLQVERRKIGATISVGVEYKY